VKFVKLPPVLHMHLMRFHYDSRLDTNVKLNDKLTFSSEMNMNEFVETSGGADDESNIYILHAVLVHFGDAQHGHYVVFIDPKCDNHVSLCLFYVFVHFVFVSVVQVRRSHCYAGANVRGD
jgi:ubiquitin C-terminal hydrolase